MDVVFVGLPGGGKSVVGRRLAHRTGATFLDLDAGVERIAGMRVSEIFEREGEAGFRALEREAIEALGPPDPEVTVRRVISTGGGAVVDPRNRWRLYRGRLPIWLDARPEVLAQRLRNSRTVRPLIARGGDPVAAVRRLARDRERFYAGATRVSGVAEVGSVLDTVTELVLDATRARRGSGTPAGRAAGTTLLRAETRIGTIVIGDGIAPAAVADVLAEAGRDRAVLASEPAAWAAFGERTAASLSDRGFRLEQLMMPTGEDAKRLAVIEDGARRLALLRVERTEPLIAIGGGALGDAAGFLAASWLRGVPLIHVPTTLVAQIDSSIGGKTAVDLPEGKNLVGAFHQPLAVIIDVAALASLPERQRRAALGEAVKMAAIGDEALFELLERDGDSIARGATSAFESGAVAELVERCAWAKVEVVLADEREQAGPDGLPGRLALNLGHSLGHAFEAATGYRDLLHGEAVAWGLRGACRIGVAIGATPAERAVRIERLLDRLGLAEGRLGLDRARVEVALGSDKKHSGRRLRWVIPTASGVELRDDVPDSVVAATLDGLLASAEDQSAGRAAPEPETIG